jgi:diacylglycerol O-acyltransferase
MSRRERMAPVDTTWLRMDRPTNLMVVVGIIILRGPVDIARLERTLGIRLTAFSRFTQRAETEIIGSWWCEDPQFDIGHHIKRVRLPEPADQTALERFVAELATIPLDRRNPLWQMHIVEDYKHGAAVVVRIHHAIGDGSALVNVFLSLTDTRDDVTPDDPAAPHHVSAEDGIAASIEALLTPIAGTIAQGLRLPGLAWRESLAIAADPMKFVGYMRDGAGVAAELAGLAAMPNDSKTRFKGKPSGDKRVAWADPISLREVKTISRALGCSVNDVLLAAVTGALHGYLIQKGDRIEGSEMRALVPVNLRGPEREKDLGNCFGVVAVELPIGVDDPLIRLREIHRRMEALKRSYEPAVTLGLLEALGYAPKLMQEEVFDILLSRATAVMTNVPGPQHPLYLAGSRIKQWIFWVPQAGDIGMGVSILSFDSHMQFGIMTDAALVPDPKAIVMRFRPEFEKLLYFVLMGPWGSDPIRSA